MKYFKRSRMAPGSKVKLKDIDPAFKDHHANHKETAAEIEEHVKWPRTERPRKEQSECS
jgi:hypothetical protein